MNEIVNKFLLAGDKFMPEMHLKQTGFTYNACGPFTKNKERIQKFKETGDTRYIYKNNIDKACFQSNMAYGNIKDLARRTASDRVSRGKVFNIAKNPKMMDIREVLLLWFINILIKNTSGSGIKNETKQNQQLAEELYKQINKKFKKEEFILHLKTIFGVFIYLICE